MKIVIIGYGNCNRRDDGLGPYVVERLKHNPICSEGVHLISVHQLCAGLPGDLKGADLILFVDATAGNIESGWSWSRLEPACDALPFTTHHMRPDFVLGVLITVYGRCPPSWMVSIQGEDFGFGTGLSPEAEERAEAVGNEIARLVYQKKRLTIIHSDEIDRDRSEP